MTAPLLLAVVLVGGFADEEQYVAALRAAGALVTSVPSIAGLLRWPDAHVVVAHAEYATPFWKAVGASHLIVLGEESMLPGADRVLPRDASADDVVAAVLSCQREPAAVDEG